MAPGFPELNQTVACRSPPSVAEAPAGGRRNRAPSDPDPAARHRITCFLNRISSSPLTTAKPSSLWHVGREEPRCTAGPQNYRLNQPKSSGKKQQLRLPLALFPVLGRAPSCRGCRNRQPPLLYKSPPSTLPAPERAPTEQRRDGENKRPQWQRRRHIDATTRTHHTSQIKLRHLGEQLHRKGIWRSLIRRRRRSHRSTTMSARKPSYEVGT
jgi:hypothetical protein